MFEQKESDSNGWAARERALAVARESRLLTLLRSERIARVDDLARQLAVSPATVRRDLSRLEQRGSIRRVHGGAIVLDNVLEEPAFDDKTRIAAEEKHRIARAAADLITPHASLFLDGGSTVLTLIPYLRDRTDLTVVTNSLRAATELAAGGPPLILVGGELRRRSQTMVGPLTDSILSTLFFDIAFLGTIGFSLEAGLTTTDPREAYTKAQVLRRTRRAVLLADSGKAGTASFVRFGRLEEIHVLITDAGLPEPMARALRRKGLEVRLV
jgi:DeoR family fructose operon transcriptional repressor